MKSLILLCGVVVLNLNVVWTQDIAFPEKEHNVMQQNKNNRQPVFIPGRCAENEWLYPGDQEDDWVCDCGPGFLYMPLYKKCYSAFRKGPCPDGEYVVLRTPAVIPECEPNPCRNDSLVPYGSQCYSINKPGPCPTIEEGGGGIYGVNATSLELDCIMSNDLKLPDKPTLCSPGRKHNTLDCNQKTTTVRSDISTDYVANSPTVRPTNLRPANTPYNTRPVNSPNTRPQQSFAPRPIDIPLLIPIALPNDGPYFQPENEQPEYSTTTRRTNTPLIIPTETTESRPVVQSEYRPTVRPATRPHTNRPVTTKPNNRPAAARPVAARPQSVPTTRPVSRPESRPEHRPESYPETRPTERSTINSEYRPTRRPSYESESLPEVKQTHVTRVIISRPEHYPDGRRDVDRREEYVPDTRRPELLPELIRPSIEVHTAHNNGKTIITQQEPILTRSSSDDGNTLSYSKTYSFKTVFYHTIPLSVNEQSDQRNS